MSAHHESGRSAELAHFFAVWPREEVPASVRHAAVRAVLNWFGCGLGGARDRAVDIAIEVASRLDRGDNATVVGRPERLGPGSAAFVNAVSSNVYDFDDTHAPTIIHPTAPVLPALLACAEMEPVAGADVLDALVMGIEAECRLGLALSPWHYERGWYITSTCGVVGAAVAVGRLLSFDADAFERAIGAATAQSAGIVEHLGTMAKSLSVGNAARNGLVAALMARSGWTCSPEALDGRRGLIRLMTAEPAPDLLTEALGERWEIERNVIKPYPGGVVVHPVIDAVRELVDRYGVTAEQVKRVDVTGPPLLRLRADRPNPLSGRDAQVSAQHAVALLLHGRSATLADYRDSVLEDDDIARTRAKVSVYDDASMPAGSAAVELETVDGRGMRSLVHNGRGSLERPMSDADMEEKFRTLVEFGSPWFDTERFIDRLWRFDEVDDVGRLIGATRQPDQVATRLGFRPVHPRAPGAPDLS